MGYYLQTPGQNHQKASKLIDMYGGKIETELDWNKFRSKELALVCVVDNNIFEAAAFAYSQEEFDYFTQLNDTRKKTWISLPWAIACKESGYEI